MHKNELCSRHYSLRDRLRLFSAVITASVLYGCGTWAMTPERERKLRTTQRKMMRKIVGAQRRKKGQEKEENDIPNAEVQADGHSSGTSSANSNSNSDSTSSEDTKGDGESSQSDDAEQDAEGEESESWAEWVVRATNLAVEAARKAGVTDWVEEQRRRKWRWAGHVARRDDGRWSRRLMGWEPHGGRRAWGRPNLRWEDALVQFAKSKGKAWHKAAQDRGQWDAWEAEFAARRW